MATAVLTGTGAALTTSEAGAAPAKPTATTTTTVPATTTTVPTPPTLPTHGPGGPNPPAGSTSSTTSTTTPIPTTTVPPQVVSALVRSIQGDLAQLDAIAGYDQDKGIVTVDEANAASAASDEDLAEAAATQAGAQLAAAQAYMAQSQHQLASLAVALYVRSDVGAATEDDDATGDATVNTSVMLGLLLSHGQYDAAQSKLDVRYDAEALRVAQQRVTAARAEAALAHQTLSKSAVALANTKLAAAGRAVQATTGTPLPNILGPAALSAGELAGWYASTGFQANTTVPMATLAGYYLSAGTTAGLRGDIAFAQSIVETGYFTFPSGGQLLGTDNNFAGIGACDSCAHGWTFPSAQTGVTAQVQLLDAYATTSKIPTPLVGRVGVAGCCQTWLSLGGVWATNPDYGYAILSIYQEILNWVIPQRLAAAGL